MNTVSSVKENRKYSFFIQKNLNKSFRIVFIGLRDQFCPILGKFKKEKYSRDGIWIFEENKSK